MKQINRCFPGIHPGILPNEAEPEGYCSPKEDISINDGYGHFISNKLYGYIHENDGKYTVYITRSSGLICFTEEEFTSFFVKKGSGH